MHVHVSDRGHDASSSDGARGVAGFVHGAGESVAEAIGALTAVLDFEALESTVGQVVSAIPAASRARIMAIVDRAAIGSIA